MSKLGLPKVPVALRPSRVMRGMEVPMRAPSTPKGVRPLQPARMARAAIVDGPMRLVVAGLASPDCQGADRLLELDGPVIFTANRHSHLDTPLILTSIPKPWRHKLIVGAAADYFFGTRITGALSALAIGAIPIERSRVGRKSADLAAELIDDGWSLLIYPKGDVAPTAGVSPSMAARRTSRPTPTCPSCPCTLPAPVESCARADHSARRRAHSTESPDLTGPRAGEWRRIWALGDRDRGAKRRQKRGPEI